MSNRGLIGLQWGDEGKGKIIDFLTDESDIVIRYQGGNNAGHTVLIGDDKYVLHLIPSGILRPDKICLIANGVVIDPRSLFEEIDYLKEKGITINNRLKIADNAHVLMPYHKAIDMLKEKGLGEKKIGTTGRGIGPCYEDKVKRTGIRMHDLCSSNKNILKDKLSIHWNETNEILKEKGEKELENFENFFNECLSFGEKLSPLLVNPVYFINEARKNKYSILFEGAQGTSLDVDFGTYPYVTSSNPTAGGMCTGSGAPPSIFEEMLGVSKAYCTRVGSGPFPSELSCSIGENIRKIGSEFGATTGRPRRCGWLDIVQLRYSCILNGVTSLVITKLDVLDDFKEIKVVTGYKKNGRVVDEFPSDISFFDDFEIVTKTFEGWCTSTKDVSSYDMLPLNAKNYLKGISSLCGFPISIVSVGAKRSQTFRI